MLTVGRSSRKRYRPGSLAGRVVALIGSHPEGISSAAIAAAFPDHDVHTCLSGLLRASRVTRLRREDSSPIRHEWYPDGFQRLRQRVSLRRIHLKGPRNTSASLMLASGIPVHVVAAWHGHDPAVSLSISSEAQRDDLRAPAPHCSPRHRCPHGRLGPAGPLA
jgi:hypothetical protein